MNLWRCGICGYVHEGEDAPEVCPKCGFPKEKYEKISSEDAEKIYRSDATNDYHMQLVKLAMQINEIADKGIEDDLDPNCVHVFQAAKKAAWQIKQRSKAEIASHMQKGKF